MSIYKILLPSVICTISLLIALCSYQEQEGSQEEDAISPRDLVILFTKTKMELAEVELEWMKAKSEGVIPKPRIEQRRSDLIIAREQYKQAMLASSGGLEKVRLCHAEEKVRLARLDLEAGKKLMDKNALSELRLKRMELIYELAELNLAMLRNPENYVTLIEALQGQIDRLGEEMVSLDLRVTKLESNL